MDICGRLRQFREAKNLSQGDVERRTGLLRCYISRVENGHTVPSVETLEKISRALEIPMYQLFLDWDNTVEPSKPTSNGKQGWASSRKGQRVLNKFRSALAKMSDKDRAVLLFTAAKMIDMRRRDA